MNWFADSVITGIDSHINKTIYNNMSNADGIDLRIEMNRILYGGINRKPLGHWVVIRKYDRSKNSESFNNFTKEGVGGPAHPYVDILLRSRRVPISVRSEQLAEIKAGAIVEDTFNYYFEYMVGPNIGDDIFEIQWDDHAIKPLNTTDLTFIERYRIERVLPYRLENGNIQYYSTISKYNVVTY